MKHENNGACNLCEAIFQRYPDFNSSLYNWFREFQKNCPESHISCAGRGRIDQEAAYARGATRAHWTQSSHNYNAAIDIFVMIPGAKDIYPREWFNTVLQPAIAPFLTWYGAIGSPFFELPHIELSGWKNMVATGAVKLVSDISGNKP